MIRLVPLAISCNTDVSTFLMRGQLDIQEWISRIFFEGADYCGKFQIDY